MERFDALPRASARPALGTKVRLSRGLARRGHDPPPSGPRRPGQVLRFSRGALRAACAGALATAGGHRCAARPARAVRDRSGGDRPPRRALPRSGRVRPRRRGVPSAPVAGAQGGGGPVAVRAPAGPAAAAPGGRDHRLNADVGGDAPGRPARADGLAHRARPDSLRPDRPRSRSNRSSSAGRGRSAASVTWTACARSSAAWPASG